MKWQRVSRCGCECVADVSEISPVIAVPMPNMTSGKVEVRGGGGLKVHRAEPDGSYTVHRRQKIRHMRIADGARFWHWAVR